MKITGTASFDQASSAEQTIFEQTNTADIQVTSCWIDPANISGITDVTFRFYIKLGATGTTYREIYSINNTSAITASFDLLEKVVGVGGTNFKVTAQSAAGGGSGSVDIYYRCIYDNGIADTVTSLALPTMYKKIESPAYIATASTYYKCLFNTRGSTGYGCAVDGTSSIVMVDCVFDCYEDPDYEYTIHFAGATNTSPNLFIIGGSGTIRIADFVFNAGTDSYPELVIFGFAGRIIIDSSCSWDISPINLKIIRCPADIVNESGDDITLLDNDNTILGYVRAMASKDANIPSDIGGTFDSANDSVEAIKDTIGQNHIDSEIHLSTIDDNITSNQLAIMNAFDDVNNVLDEINIATGIHRYAIAFDFTTYSKAVMLFYSVSRPFGATDPVAWCYIYTANGTKPSNTSETVIRDVVKNWADEQPA